VFLHRCICVRYWFVDILKCLYCFFFFFFFSSRRRHTRCYRDWSSDVCSSDLTVGPRQTGRYGMVVPRFVDQALRGEPITVYGDGQQSRCLTHVSDAVRAAIGLMDSDRTVGEVFNVGSEEEIKSVELAERVRRLTETESEIAFVPYW